MAVPVHVLKNVTRTHYCLLCPGPQDCCVCAYQPPPTMRSTQGHAGAHLNGRVPGNTAQPPTPKPEPNQNPGTKQWTMRGRPNTHNHLLPCSSHMPPHPTLQTKHPCPQTLLANLPPHACPALLLSLSRPNPLGATCLFQLPLVRCFSCSHHTSPLHSEMRNSTPSASFTCSYVTNAIAMEGTTLM